MPSAAQLWRAMASASSFAMNAPRANAKPAPITTSRLPGPLSLRRRRGASATSPIAASGSQTSPADTCVTSRLGAAIVSAAMPATIAATAATSTRPTRSPSRREPR